MASSCSAADLGFLLVSTTVAVPVVCASDETEASSLNNSASSAISCCAKLDVMTKIASLHSTVVPLPSVIRPSSNSCNMMVNTSGCAFSTSSNNTTAFGPAGEMTKNQQSTPTIEEQGTYTLSTFLLVVHLRHNPIKKRLH